MYVQGKAPAVWLCPAVTILRNSCWLPALMLLLIFGVSAQNIAPPQTLDPPSVPSKHDLKTPKHAQCKLRGPSRRICPSTATHHPLTGINLSAFARRASRTVWATSTPFSLACLLSSWPDASLVCVVWHVRRRRCRLRRCLRQRRGVRCVFHGLARGTRTRSAARSTCCACWLVWCLVV